MEGIEILQKPILPDEIEWKVQSYTKDKSKTIIVPYITNRCILDRFDMAFGLNWKSEHREVKDGFICRISIWDEKKQQWIYREDGANRTSIEPVKGGISDAMKRAAHQWGLGRILYTYPRVLLTGEVRYIPDSVIERLGKMVLLINQGNFNQKKVII